MFLQGIHHGNQRIYIFWKQFALSILLSFVNQYLFWQNELYALDACVFVMIEPLYHDM